MAGRQSATLVCAFEVAPDADEAFLAGRQWTPAGARGRTELFRALRADVAFRFVAVARVESGDDGFAPAGGEPAVTAHAGRYEVVREEGTVDIAGGVVRIEPFEAGADAAERFLGGWDHGRGLLAGQQGYIGTRLLRALGPAGFRFVELARWSSPLMVARALRRPELREALEEMPFASHPALYQAVRD
jgi:hypothetical protein